MAEPRETKPGNTKAKSLVIPCATLPRTKRAAKPVTPRAATLGTPRATTPEILMAKTLGTTDPYSTPINMNIFSQGINIVSLKSSLSVS